MFHSNAAQKYVVTALSKTLHKDPLADNIRANVNYAELGSMLLAAFEAGRAHERERLAKNIDALRSVD